MIVTTLESRQVAKYYRFYGARHSILQMGYLIDYEVQQDSSNFLPRLKGVSHIGFPWLYEREKLMLWHQFLAIFEPHFRDVATVEPFYFNILLKAAKRWHKQSAKRLIIETFIAILQYEGRVQNTERCVVCNSKLGNECSLIKGYLPAHPECVKELPIKTEAITHLFQSGSTILLSDAIVDSLYLIALKGF